LDRIRARHRPSTWAVASPKRSERQWLRSYGAMFSFFSLSRSGPKRPFHFVREGDIGWTNLSREFEDVKRFLSVENPNQAVAPWGGTSLSSGFPGFGLSSRKQPTRAGGIQEEDGRKVERNSSLGGRP